MIPCGVPEMMLKCFIFVKRFTMRKAVISFPEDKDKSFYVKLFKKMGISVRFLSDDDAEDMMLGKMIEEGKTGEFVSREEVFKALDKNGR